MSEGIQLRLTHAQRALPAPYLAGTVRTSSIMIDDIRETENQRGLVLQPQYVPFGVVGTAGFIDLDYTSLVARSYETGDIRRLITQGEVTHAFFVGGFLQLGMEGPVVITAVAGAPTPDVHTATVDESFFIVDTTLDPVTINLPSGLLHRKGLFQVVDLGGNASTNNITIVANGAETIDGGANFVHSVDNGRFDFFWDAANTDWFPPVVSSGLTPAATAVTPYAANVGEFIEVTTGAPGFTVNLPNPGLAGDRVVVKKVDGGAGVVTVSSNGGPNIDGGATHLLNVQYQSVTLMRGTTQWWIE